MKDLVRLAQSICSTTKLLGWPSKELLQTEDVVIAAKEVGVEEKEVLVEAKEVLVRLAKILPQQSIDLRRLRKGLLQTEEGHARLPHHVRTAYRRLRRRSKAMRRGAVETEATTCAFAHILRAVFASYHERKAANGAAPGKVSVS